VVAGRRAFDRSSEKSSKKEDSPKATTPDPEEAGRWFTPTPGLQQP
jgi:hypothetical protein